MSKRKDYSEGEFMRMVSYVASIWLHYIFSPVGFVLLWYFFYAAIAYFLM